MKTELIESNLKSLGDDLDAGFNCHCSALAVFALPACTLHRYQADLANKIICVCIYICICICIAAACPEMRQIW